MAALGYQGESRPPFPLDPSYIRGSLPFSVRACGGSLNWFPAVFFPHRGLLTEKNTETVMSQEFIAVLDYMEKERGIKRELLYEAVHAALLAAARKSFGPARDLSVELDQKTGKIKAIARLLVVEKVTLPHDEISLPKARLPKPDAVLGGTVEVAGNTRDFGRIAAQVFKPAMNQPQRGIQR